MSTKKTTTKKSKSTPRFQIIELKPKINPIEFRLVDNNTKNDMMTIEYNLYNKDDLSENTVIMNIEESYVEVDHNNFKNFVNLVNAFYNKNKSIFE